ncbi:MAG: DUF3821 domain-containing protein, partial [Methanophagales archaeon]|nr:DUF3821 domain-containing protein [Methanophagales archaeon]
MMAPMGMARDDENVSDTAGGIRDGDVLFIGEHGLHFNTTDVKGRPTMLKKIEDGDVVETITINASNFYIPDGVEENGYNLFNASGDLYTDVTIKEPEITANIFRGLKGASTDSIVGKSIPAGTKLTVRVEPNFGGIMKNAADGNWSKIKVKLIDPHGIYMMKKIDADAQEISLGPTVGFNDVVWDQLDTTNWNTGTWKVKVTTDKATCNDLDISSSEYEFTVRSSELSIDAVEEVVYKGEDIILTVTGYPNYYYYFAIENVTAGDEPYIKDTADIVSLGTGEGSPGAATAAWIKTGSDGRIYFTVSTINADERTYTMWVYDTYHIEGGVPNETDEFRAPTDAIWGGGEGYFPVARYGEVDVKVYKRQTPSPTPSPMPTPIPSPSVSFIHPSSRKVIIGENGTPIYINRVSIGGALNFRPDSVDILIENGDVAYFDDAPVSLTLNFEVSWRPEGMIPGSYTIDVYADCPMSSYDEITAAGIEKVGSTTISFVLPSTPTPSPTSEETSTPVVTPTATPQVEKDSDGDGVPDEYEYAPNDPNVQTKEDVMPEETPTPTPTPTVPGFRVVFAIGSLLAVA